jgi:hypothetical protein
MTTEITLENKATTKQDIVQLITNNVSAIPLIAEHLQIDDELVISLLEDLVEEKTLKGTICENGLRFYRSDVKMPTHFEESEEEEIEDNPMAMVPKLIVATGIIMFITGQIFTRVFTQGTPLQETSAGLVVLGLFAIFGGLFSFTKFE